MEKKDGKTIYKIIKASGLDDTKPQTEVADDTQVIEIDLEEVFLYGNLDFVDMPQELRDALYSQMVSSGMLTVH
ncbi:hypothetical protein ACMXYV_04745 [Neptuniibacter sp. SY11_33]|uniref:hypothetical protein n=1 Tax=Neptuniibacter sp. SY11_33 TaxID=3398215 RepID=UPI0039F63994